jgi:glycosyltransferase involved in cell wall biosynthesis
VNGWYLKSYLQAIWACKRLQIPVLSRSDSTLMTRRSTAWRALKHRPYRWLVRAIDGHLYAGQANLEYLRRYGVDADRLFFVPHFVDNEFFSAGARSARQSGGAAAVRAAHGIPADATVFIVVGTLLERKRHVDFLDALDRLRRDLPGVWGLVVGAGPLEHHLKSVAAQRNLPVRFAGFQNQSQLPEHYAAADAIVLPSSADETWGLVVNEAMACGLPAIVSSGCGCSRDVIDANRTGLVFPVGDVAALSSAMRWLTDLLKTGRRAIHDAVAAKIAQYGCSAAVAGTQVALHAVTRQRRHAAPAQPVQT